MLYRNKFRDKTGKLVRSKVWWYDFVFHGERIRASTKTANRRAA